MAILFSSDFHENKNDEFFDISEKRLRENYQHIYNDIKYHIILGDGGFPVPKDTTAWSGYKSLSHRPFPILCVFGNHEPILGMKEKELRKLEEDIGIGEKVYKIKKEFPFVAYLKRGKVYNIDGFKFLVLGGALTINKEERVKKNTWWENEYWSEQEEQDVFKLLENENTFDYVLSHTGPHRINEILFGDKRSFSKEIDKVAVMNDKIDAKIQCNGWWCGHWHTNGDYHDKKNNRQYRYLDKVTIKILSKENGEPKIYN